LYQIPLSLHITFLGRGGGAGQRVRS